MNIRERFDRFLDKVITALCWETTAELHIQRTWKVYGHLYRHHQIKILEGHCEKEITGEAATAEPTYITDTEQTPVERELVGV